MKRIVLTSFFGLCFFLENALGQRFDQDHTTFKKFLGYHVVFKGLQSYVRYGEIRKNPQELNNYLAQLSAVTKAEYAGFKMEEKLAFLINAYNAFSIKLVADNYPVKSIKKIGGWFKSPWKIEFIPLLEETMGLDKIEHDIIRKEFGEPRIHFALHRATLGGPPLMDKPFVGSTLEEQLHKVTKSFITNKEKNRFVPEKQKLEVSKIFDWYKWDFIKSDNSIELFVGKFMFDNADDRDKLRSEKIKLEFLDYDWSLNDLP